MTTDSADDDKKQGKTFSLSKGLLKRLQMVLDKNGLDASELSDLAEVLLNHSLGQLEEGSFQLPIEHIPVLRRPR